MEAGSIRRCSPPTIRCPGKRLLYENLNALTVAGVAHIKKVAYLPTIEHLLQTGGIQSLNTRYAPAGTQSRADQSHRQC